MLLGDCRVWWLVDIVKCERFGRVGKFRSSFFRVVGSFVGCGIIDRGFERVVGGSVEPASGVELS